MIDFLAIVALAIVVCNPVLRAAAPGRRPGAGRTVLDETRKFRVQ